MLRAIIFDFDGTILDTETPEYQAWREIYRQHGADLPPAVWARAVGTSADAFDPVGYLEELIGQTLPRDAIEAAQFDRVRALIAGEVPRPGVVALLRAARERHLKVGLASSSSRAYVAAHLERLGLRGDFDILSARDDVERVKPDPALYLYALRRLGVAATEAIAIEDSPNGLLAARAAGLACLVVPNPVTIQFAFPADAIRRDSLDGVTLVFLENLRGAGIDQAGDGG